jgi:DNA-binding NarL/FixJ family response regulator
MGRRRSGSLERSKKPAGNEEAESSLAEDSGELRSAHRRLLTASPVDLTAALQRPLRGDLDAATYNIGSDEYLVFSFPNSDASTSRSDGAGHRLTEAEQDIIRQIAEGRSNSEIARSRRTSPRTIANQVTSIYRKLGVRSRRELAAFRSRTNVVAQ